MSASVKDFALKAIKHSEFASEETHCYEAKLYYKGKAIAIVKNDGHGGCDDHYPLPGCELDWQDAVVAAKSLPKVTTSIKNDDGTFWEMEQDIETVCHDLVNAHLVTKDFKRLVAKRVIYKKKGSDSIWQTGAARNAATRDAWVKQIAEREDTEVVLNTLPMVEALELFRSAA